MYSQILVPLDGSAFAEHALPAAIAISRLTKATIHLVRVHEQSATRYASRGRPDELSRRQELEYLHIMAARAIAAGSNAVVTTVVDGWPPSAIEREVARTGADLVVITDRGHSGLATRCLGAVSDTLVRQSRIPVLVMRASDRAVDLEHCALFRNILVAIDDADADASVVEDAVRLGSLGNARYTLFHAVRPALTTVQSFAYAAAATTLDAGATRARVSTTRHELAELASHMRDRARPNGIDIEITIDTHPATSILDAIGEGTVDVVAMSTRVSEASCAVAGGVAEEVACSTALPILMCPAFTPTERGV
jgi:nucleotide-binding universal stress UspA family protein